MGGIFDKAMILGLDGATYDLLVPWMDQGRLPHLKRLYDASARGGLHTVIPPVTPAAWSTFMTGTNPGKHGVLEFIVKDGRGGESPVNARLRHGTTIFRRLSDAGKKVVALNVPTTYPPEQINGVMVSDFLTPTRAGDYIYPPEMRAAIEEKFGKYSLYITKVYSADDRDSAGPVIDDALRDLDYKRDVALWLKDEIDWDFFMVHFFATDRIQHELWHIFDDTHPLHDPRESEKYLPRIFDLYAEVDNTVGAMSEGLGDDTVLMLMSDHGFGPVHTFFNTNAWLLEEGFLVLKKSALARVRHAGFKLGFTPKNAYVMAGKLGFQNLRLSTGVDNRKRVFDLAQKFFLSLHDVDWEKTRAFARGYYGQLFINLAGREPHGSVPPEKYDATLAALIAALKRFHDPRTGEPIVGPILTRDDAFHGPFAKFAPDISFLPKDMRYKAIGTMDFTSNKVFEPVYGNPGDHRLNGIFLAHGAGIRAGDVDGAHIGDVAPTLMHMLGYEVPDEMDGKVLEDILTDESRVTLGDVRAGFAQQATGTDDAAPASGFTDLEKEDIKKHLKGIGYL